jgi:hypothetical protein
MKRHLSLLFLLAALATTGCASPLTQRIEAMRDTLQNPAYPGDANRDVAPYQARQRDLAACYWDNLVPLTGLAVKEDDALIETAFRQCMAAKGWR